MNNEKIENNIINNMAKEEEKRMRRKILSNLSFISIDLGSIERLEIKDEGVRKIVSEIRERVDGLKNRLIREDGQDSQVK